MGSLVGRHALWTGAILLACGQGADNEPSARGDVTSRATVTQTEQADSQEQPLSLEWTFEPDSEEVAAVRVLIRSLVDRQRDPPLGASGVLYRFGSEQAQTRYLLLTYMETGHMQNEPDAVLFVLDKPHNSEPMVIGRWGIGTWGPLRLRIMTMTGSPMSRSANGPARTHSRARQGSQVTLEVRGTGSPSRSDRFQSAEGRAHFLKWGSQRPCDCLY